MMQRRAVFGVWCAAALRVSAAWGQPATPTPETVMVRYERALDALTANHPAEARPLLEAVVEVEPTGVHLFNLALAYRALNLPAAALENFERALAATPDTFRRRERRAIERQLPRLRSACGRLTFVGLPSGATVRVDGRPVTVRAEGNFVDAGARVIETTAEGFRPGRRELAAVAGENLRVELMLEREEPAIVVPPTRPAVPVVVAVAPAARLVIDPSVPSAVVRLDGVEIGRGHVDRETDQGSHVVEVSAEGYEPFTRTLRVGTTGVTRLDAGLVQRGRPGWVLPMAIAGGLVVLGGIVAGVVLATQPAETPITPNWGQINEAIVGR